MTGRSERYSATLRTLHWAIAILIIANAGLGLYLGALDGTAGERWYELHKGLGVVAFGLVLVRLVRRMVFETPPTPPVMSHWQLKGMGAVHVTLYAGMVLIPLTGYLASSAAGFATPVFGVVTIGPLIDENRDAYTVVRLVHQWMNYVMIGLIIGHVGAALKHQFFDRRDIFARISLNFRCDHPHDRMR